MRLYHPQMESVLEWETPGVPSLVVENPSFFRALMMDLYTQRDGEKGNFVLTDSGKDLALGTWAEIIDNCLRFELNTKLLLNRIAAAMEKAAVSEELFVRTAEILQQLEQYVNEVAFSLDCDIVCERCTPGSVFKAVGLSLRDCYEDPLERLADYMELVRELDRDRLFILVNMRSFFEDDRLELFLETVAAHGYRVLLMDGIDRKKLSSERRITIDNDLCEF